MLNFWPYYIREIWTSRLKGSRKAALFGAGEHSRWLLDLVQGFDGPRIVCLIDDRADAIREIKGIRVVTPDECDPRSFDVIVVSSDSAEEALLTRARQCFPRTPIVRLYEGLPPGPYDKQGDIPAGIDALPLPGETVNLETVVGVASSAKTKHRLVQLFQRMDADVYAQRLVEGYTRGLDRFGEDWRYVDLWSIVYAYARLAPPRDYLEIGTRRGHSLAAVLAGCADASAAMPAVVSCDMWVEQYAGVENPGPGFVAAQMKRLGFDANIEFLGGSSHELVRPYLTATGRTFDLITVDGDHSRDGARQDLTDVTGALRLGGMIAFDDIHHPQHAYLGQVWRDVFEGRSAFETYENPRNGTGIAAAIRYRRS